MKLAAKGQNIKNKEQYDPTYQNEQGQTIAMIYAQNKFIPDKYWQHDPSIKDKQNYTVFMYFLESKMLPPLEWIPQQIMEDYEQITIINNKMLLPFPKSFNLDKMSIFDKAYFKIIPNSTGHKPNKKDQDGFTVAMILAINGIQIPKQWKHNSQIQNNYGMTVAMYMAERNQKVPNEWYYNQLIRNINNYTVAMFYAQNGTIPENKWSHDKQQRCKYQINQKIYYYTVQNFLYDHKIKKKNQWWNYKNVLQDDNTEEMIQAKRGQIPILKKCNKIQANIHDETVGLILSQQGIIPPEQWLYNVDDILYENKTIRQNLIEYQMPVPNYSPQELCQDMFTLAILNNSLFIDFNNNIHQNDDGFTFAMIQACLNRPITRYYEHNPSLTNIYGYTVALYQARNGKIPDKQWIHNKFMQCQVLENNYYKYYTVQDFLIKNNYQEIPEEWKYNTFQNYEELTQEQNNLIQNYRQHVQNQNIIPFDLFVKVLKIVPPEEYCNDQQYQDINGNTQAMILAQNKIEIPEYLQHDPNIKNNQGYTVALHLAEQGIVPPEIWRHDKFIRVKIQKQFLTVQDLLALKQVKLRKHSYWWYNITNDETNEFMSEISNTNQQDIEVPNNYNASEQNLLGQTAAMILAEKPNSYIPTNLYHDPTLVDYKNETVAMKLLLNNTIPNSNWLYDKYIFNCNGESLQSILFYKGYYYKNKQIFENYYIQNIASICGNCGQNKTIFIKQKCVDNICLDCFKMMQQQDNVLICPCCGKYQWFQTVIDLQFSQQIRRRQPINLTNQFSLTYDVLDFMLQNNDNQNIN